MARHFFPYGNKTPSVRSEAKILYDIVISPPCGEEMCSSLYKHCPVHDCSWSTYVLNRESQNQYIVNVVEIRKQTIILTEGNLC